MQETSLSFYSQMSGGLEEGSALCNPSDKYSSPKYQIYCKLASISENVNTVSIAGRLVHYPRIPISD
jgi:hypothetical protein